MEDVFPTDEDYVAETVLEGEEYGVDGAVLAGQVQVTLLRKKLNTRPPFRQCVGYLAVTKETGGELYKKTAAYLQKAAQSIGMDDCLLHCDLMVGQNQLNIIEISARPSGHNLHNLFSPLATGVDLIEAYIDYMEGRTPQTAAENIQSLMIGYFDFEDVTLLTIPPESELPLQLRQSLLYYQPAMAAGYMPAVRDGHQLMQRGFYILRGSDEQDLLHKREILKAAFPCKKGECNA